MLQQELTRSLSTKTATMGEMVFRELMTETHLAWRGQLQQKHCSETLLQRDVPAAWCVSPSVGSILPGRRQREVEERAWGTSSLARVGGIEWCLLLLRANWRELWWGWSTQQSKLETFFSKILEAPLTILLTKKDFKLFFASKAYQRFMYGC